MKVLTRALIALVCALPGFVVAGPPPAARPLALPSLNQLMRRPLSLPEALNIAAEQNAVILSASKALEAQFGVAVQVRAIALPKVLASASYLVQQDSRIEANQNRELPEFELSLPRLGIETTLGGGNSPRVNNQTWIADVRIVQSIYEGGRIQSALRQNRLIREQALYDYQTAISDVLLSVRIAYEDAQLATLQINLRNQSVNLLGALAGKIEEQRKVGVVTEFEELRAKVEQNNARTPLSLAGQDFVIAKQRLLQLLGYDLPPTASNQIPLNLSTPLGVPKYQGGLATALVNAERQRSELASIRIAAKLGDEAIIVAKSGYKPSIQGFAGYGALSRVQSRNAGDPLVGGLAGIQSTWAIFDGLLTKGRVAEAGARRDQIAFNTDELTRQIGVQVRSEWERMNESRVILEIQGANITSAVRAVELSNVRFGAGIGSEVEVLSAQSALTDARDFYATALRNYSVAYSRLLRATGEDLQRSPP